MKQSELHKELAYARLSDSRNGPKTMRQVRTDANKTTASSKNHDAISLQPMTS